MFNLIIITIFAIIAFTIFAGVKAGIRQTKIENGILRKLNEKED